MSVEEVFNHDIKLLKELRNSCHCRNEPILEYYCECMLKIRRAYYKAEQTELLLYIRQIMKAAFPLVCGYFKECVEMYREEVDPHRRAEILQDIENSVVEFDEMFDSIIHATNNVDRILFQTAPIATATHSAAPKLCAFYSEMLNRLASVLTETDPANMMYGFCVYPTLNSGVKATILFSTVEKNGKVVIIRIPSKDMADINRMRIYLIHELFHVIPGEILRHRKKRADVFLKLLMYNIREIIFLNCDFAFLEAGQKDAADSDKRITEIEEIIIGELFADTESKVNEAIGKKDQRVYYSFRIENIFMDVFYSDFTVFLNDRIRKLFEVLLDKYFVSGMNYNAYGELYRGIKSLCQCIGANLYDYIAASEFYDSCKFYMGIFRETFADLMMLNTLRLDLKEYIDALNSLDQALLNEELFTEVRLYLVSRVMKEMPGEYTEGTWEDTESWEQYVCGISENKRMNCEKNETVLKLSGDERRDIGIRITQTMMDQYVGYLKECLFSYESKKEDLGGKYEDYAKAFLVPDGNTLVQRICCRNW